LAARACGGCIGPRHHTYPKSKQIQPIYISSTPAKEKNKILLCLVYFILKTTWEIASMNPPQTGLSANFYNKSELIRDVARAVPGMTNKQVKKIIRDRYGIDVASNLIIAVLGKERTRKLLAPVRSKLMQLGLEWFELCGRDRGYCAELLSSFP
jgi:hypothetical protein